MHDNDISKKKNLAWKFHATIFSCMKPFVRALGGENAFEGNSNGATFLSMYLPTSIRDTNLSLRVAVLPRIWKELAMI